jgi:hypothetical protein
MSWNELRHRIRQIDRASSFEETEVLGEEHIEIPTPFRRRRSRQVPEVGAEEVGPERGSDQSGGGDVPSLAGRLASKVG